MKFTLLHVYTLLSLALVGSHGVSPKVYWQSTLPQSPMPKAIKDLLFKAWDDGNEEVFTDDASTYTDQPKQTYSHVASKDELKDNHRQFYSYAASKDDASVYLDEPEQTYSYVVSKDELKDNHRQFYSYAASKDDASLYLDEPEQTYSYVVSKDDASLYLDEPEQTYSYVVSKDELKDHYEQSYWYAASKDQLKALPEQFYKYDASKGKYKDNLLAKLLFLEKDFYQGKEMTLHFINNDQKFAFLPREISDSIPFSSKDLQVIYDRFSVKPDSMEAKILKHTLKLCEHEGIKDEDKMCATSLESMIDFSITKLGKRVKALSTEVNAKESPPQKYKIERIKNLATHNAVVCHKQNYAYAVFYCHITPTTRSYVVSLEGANGTKVKSIALCHNDTANWNPNYLAFKVLKVKPGAVPICHFLPEEHVLWVQTY